jgi:hypothetical protein
LSILLTATRIGTDAALIGGLDGLGYAVVGSHDQHHVGCAPRAAAAKPRGPAYQEGAMRAPDLVGADAVMRRLARRRWFADGAKIFPWSTWHHRDHRRVTRAGCGGLLRLQRLPTSRRR